MPGLRRATRCKACGKPISFIKTLNGKSIPVDPEPITFLIAEEYQKFVTEDGEVERGLEVEGNEGGGARPMMEGYRRHIDSCPEAHKLRKNKNKSERVRKDD